MTWRDMQTSILPGESTSAALAFTEDGRRLIAGHDRTVAVFDATTGRLVRTLTGAHHGHGARVLLVRGDDLIVLSGSSWAIAHWALSTGKYHGKLEARSPGQAMAAAPGQNLLWVATDRKLEAFDLDSGLALYDPKRRRRVRELTAIASRDYRDDLTGVAVASGDGAVLFWSDRAWGILPTGAKAKPTVVKTKTSTGGMLDARWGYLVHGDRIAPVDTRTGKCGKAVAVGFEPTTSSAAMARPRAIVAGERHLRVVDWNGRTLVPTSATPLPAGELAAVSCSPDGARAAVAVLEETRVAIHWLDLERGTVAAKPPPPEKKPKPGPRFSKNDPAWGVPEEQWTADQHLDFREYVANEHLLGGMPIVELHRNHDIALSAVRRWIALVREGGRTALSAAMKKERTLRSTYRA